MPSCVPRFLHSSFIMHPNRLPAFLIPSLKIIAVAMVLGWILYRFPENHWRPLLSASKDWRFLFLALSTALLAHLVSFWRWKILLGALGLPMRLIEACRLGFLGSTLNMVSVGSVGGDVFKAVAAARLAPGKRTEVVTSVLVDRAIGLLGLVLVASFSLSLATALSPTMRWIWSAALTLSALGSLALLLVLLFGRWLPTHRFQKLPWIGQIVFRVANSCMVFYGRPWLVVQMIVTSLMVHSLLTTSCWLISIALYHSEPNLIPTLAQHFQAIPPAMAAATLPITPGGVGIQELLIQTLFAEIPEVSSAFSGLVVATTYRAILVVIALIGAVVYLTGNERRLVAQDLSATTNAALGAKTNQE
jgi:uncharacterized membrane protein YbhN (UPF0104 family)